MSEEKVNPMQCSDFYEIADSYLGDELLVETNHEVLQHLEGCANCRRELDARRGLRAKLRAAFPGDAALRPRPEFAERLRADLRSKALGQARARPIFGRVSGWGAAIAASLLLAVGAGLFTLQWRQSSSSPADVIATRDHTNTEATGNAVGSEPSPQNQAPLVAERAGFELREAAAGVHRDCAINFRLAEHPIDLDEAGHKYDRAYLNLASVVKKQSADVAGQVEFIESHSCVFKGQRFAHIVLKHRGRIVSLLVAERAQDETASRARQTASAEDVRRQVIACSRSESFQVSCFETARHAVFVVSDLSEAENLAVARAFAASVQAHLARAENAA